MPSPPDSSRRLYGAVILCEILVIAALWFFGRYYS
jgi:hypothetical protein